MTPALNLNHLQPRYFVAYNDDRPIPEPRPVSYDYILAGNGLFKQARNDFLTALILAVPFRITSLLSLAEKIQPSTRFPGRQLNLILEDALNYAAQGQERMYFLHQTYNGTLQHWVTSPEQQGSAERVAYRPSHSAQTVICDLHSHHTMRAFFSGIDNADEQGFGFYAVIGNLLERPEIRLRLGMYGHFVDLPATTLFDGLGPFVDAYPGGPARPYPDPDDDAQEDEPILDLDLSETAWERLTTMSLTHQTPPAAMLERLITAAWENGHSKNGGPQ